MWKIIKFRICFGHNFLNNNIDIEGEELSEETNNEAINTNTINDIDLDRLNINDILKDRGF